MPSSEDTSNSMKLRKAINRERGSLVWETVDDDTVQILSSTCSSRNINFTGAKRSKFRSLRTKADQLANKGTPVLINVDDNTVRKDTRILILLQIFQQLLMAAA